jgi:hypothetical protein
VVILTETQTLIEQMAQSLDIELSQIQESIVLSKDNVVLFFVPRTFYHGIHDTNFDTKVQEWKSNCAHNALLKDEIADLDCKHSVCSQWLTDYRNSKSLFRYKHLKRYEQELKIIEERQRVLKSKLLPEVQPKDHFQLVKYTTYICWFAWELDDSTACPVYSHDEINALLSESDGEKVVEVMERLGLKSVSTKDMQNIINGSIKSPNGALLNAVWTKSKDSRPLKFILEQAEKDHLKGKMKIFPGKDDRQLKFGEGNTVTVEMLLTPNSVTFIS